MLFSGIAWSDTGFEVAVLDAAGQPAAEPRSFGTRHSEELISFLRGLDDNVAVIDSTNGMLDGRMMAAGLTVYRADAARLPARHRFGSVPAATLADAAAGDLSTLTRLIRHRGTQTGREPDLERWIEGSTAATAELTAAGRCLSFGPRDRMEVALTFDDGPNPPYTDRILDICERYDIRATFFCVGLNADAQPDLIARMKEQGHSFGNHTFSHPFLPELSHAELAEQVERTAECIAGAGGVSPALFRPPYGSRTPEVLGWLARLDPTVVLWDVEAADWSMPGAEVIADSVLRQTRPGAIVLLHDGGGDRSQTVAALPVIIEGLLARGLRFVGVEEMIAR